jgi:hypothetical protein
LILPTIIFTFENTKITTLKTGTPLNISKSFFGKPPELMLNLVSSVILRNRKKIDQLREIK